MLKNTLIWLFVIMMIKTPFNMNSQEIKLPAPQLTGGMSFAQAVAARHSSRDFNPEKTIDDTVLGQLLWSAVGVNRSDAASPIEGKAPADRCNPTALNSQEITAYVFSAKGVYEYLPHTHSLAMRKEGDHRVLLAGTKAFSQDFVTSAPYVVLFVADMSKLPKNEASQLMAAMDAGIACENLNLACSALGVSTVPRATMDHAGVSALLGLPATQILMLNNPIGY